VLYAGRDNASPQKVHHNARSIGPPVAIGAGRGYLAVVPFAFAGMVFTDSDSLSAPASGKETRHICFAESC
jgi:hypothetical protein